MPLLKEIRSAGGPIGASVLFSGSNLNMSQATIGRQLTVLEKEGILKKVSNKGRVLTESGLALIAQHDLSSTKTKLAEELVSLSLKNGKSALGEVLEIRKRLEPYAAASAAMNATDADIADLENLAFAHRYTLAQGLAANREDLKFHLAIARISKNQMLAKLIELLLTDNDAYVMFSRAGDASRDRQVTKHFHILDAIRSHDVAAAELAMSEHLSNVAEDVEHICQG